MPLGHRSSAQASRRAVRGRSGRAVCWRCQTCLHTWCVCVCESAATLLTSQITFPTFLLTTACLLPSSLAKDPHPHTSPSPHLTNTQVLHIISLMPPQTCLGASLVLPILSNYAQKLPSASHKTRSCTSSPSWPPQTSLSVSLVQPPTATLTSCQPCSSQTHPHGLLLLPLLLQLMVRTKLRVHAPELPIFIIYHRVLCAVRPRAYLCVLLYMCIQVKAVCLCMCSPWLAVMVPVL